MPRPEAVLVTGGAGYVGAAVVRALRHAGHRPVVVDDLSAGHRRAVAGVPLLRARCGEVRKVAEFARRHGVRAAVHAAASCLVGESVVQPAKYYRNNLAEGLGLLEALRAAGVGRLIFSSSAAVYGEPRSVPISEDHPQQPVNPYGETKAAFEQALRWHCPAYGLAAVALRFFNAAGASQDGAHGEDHAPETHLIPCLLRHALRRSAYVELFGTDYPTPDGTPVRDFVHVDDLAAAHLLALERCRQPRTFWCFNLGTGAGASVREVLRCAERVVGRKLRVREKPRRAGDPAFLVASNERARETLGWRPERSLEQIVESAWKWHRTHPHGYRSARLVRKRNAVIRSARGARGD
jgi:UDP-glucose-4-epimerase GalE